ncbi:MAG: prenyltransferase/squalene oxidase repeat-containing protein [Patescibacteria group bacterium]
MKKSLFVLLFAVAPMFSFADATSTATVTIRNGSTTAFTGVVEIAASTTAPIEITPTHSSTTVAVPADSLLATLVALDATTTDFDITDIAYFSSFNSFIINCITIPATSTEPYCFNWTYAVNSDFPQVGVDHQILQNGDAVYLFFGPPRQTVLSTTTVSIGEPFTATAQSYDLASGTYVGASGLTLGVGTPNPDFSFTELATSTSDTNGEAIFTLNATGTFSVGIQEDFYFPSAMITIVDVATTSSEETSAPSANNPPPTGGGGGGGETVHFNVNMPTALSYLASKQSANGSFGSSLLDDWVAIAFAAADPGAPKILLREYLLSTAPALSSVTDYERHVMALTALGINPYSGTSVDYIAPIVNAFDGIQIGDPTLDNDDIFAMFALVNAGYGSVDPIIQKVGAFILSKQLPNGSWDNNPDMTAAGAQAASLLFGTPGINSSTLGQSLGMASGYLASTQQSDGGWGNVDSTSWVQTMINAVQALDPAHASTWTSSGGRYPMDAIANAQQVDGAVRPISDTVENRVWSTSYAVVAASGKSWLTVLQPFSRPSTAGTTISGGGAWDNSMTSTATSTQAAASTTPPVATSTPTVLGTSTTAGVASSTASTTKPIAQKSVLKKKAVKKSVSAQTAAIPTSTLAQTAAAPSLLNGSLFGKIWRTISSFFAALF